MLQAFRRHYGASPLHLIGLLGSFALSGYVASRVAGAPGAARIGLWFGGAVVGHDLVLYPLYALADRRLHAPRRLPGSPLRTQIVNHIRVPALISGLLLLIWFPLVFGLSDDVYRANVGLTTRPYLGRWLLVSGLLFAGSAALLGVRITWRRRRPRSPFDE